MTEGNIDSNARDPETTTIQLQNKNPNEILCKSDEMKSYRKATDEKN